jgi:hypothetical protein
MHCQVLDLKSFENTFPVIAHYEFIFVKNLGNNSISMYYCHWPFICFILFIRFYDHRKSWGFYMQFEIALKYKGKWLLAISVLEQWFIATFLLGP